jgi:hypothetical protein
MLDHPAVMRVGGGACLNLVTGDAIAAHAEARLGPDFGFGQSR